MLAHRLRRCANIRPALVECLVIAEMWRVQPEMCRVCPVYSCRWSQWCTGPAYCIILTGVHIPRNPPAWRYITEQAQQPPINVVLVLGQRRRRGPNTKTHWFDVSSLMGGRRAHAQGSPTAARAARERDISLLTSHNNNGRVSCYHGNRPFVQTATRTTDAVTLVSKETRLSQDQTIHAFRVGLQTL